EVPTIAEGVETAEQYAELKALGCNIIQGYYFSRPLPADDFEKLIIKTLKKETEEC
ncbi:MAG: EAL domain-containing protein, partial [Oscillospiraceae bacterium]|nr:EAL domain-containing protein [Oscillospiraceae bacterium]